jgi:hypothetical protein
MLIHNADITGSLTINGIPYNTGSFTGSFFGDGSQLSGVTSYTDADTLAFINSIEVVSGSIETRSTVSDTFTSVTSYTVTHNFDTKEVIVSVYENDTLIFPSSINTPTTNTVTITFPEPVTGRVVVVKAGHIVSGSIDYSNVLNKPTLVSGSSQITYSDVTGIPSGIVSGSAQIVEYNVFATTGSNQFDGSQVITGSLTVTGEVVAQTLNVQEVTSSIVFSSGSNIFGNDLGNTQQFTGSVSITGSLTVNGSGLVPYTGATADVNLEGSSITSAMVYISGLNTGGEGGVLNLKKGSTRVIGGSDAANTISVWADGTTLGFNDVAVGGVRSAKFSVASITNNATRTYTLPNADGTLALTSNLSDYLPLTGGTLTGALNGTSATFSSTASFLTNTGASTSEKQIIVANTGGSMRAGVESSAGNAIQLDTLAYAAVFGNQANAATQFTTSGTARMTILGGGNVGIGTTGPATFLHVAGTSAKTLTGLFHTCIQDFTPMATGVGGGITFMGYKIAQSNQEAFAGIDGFKENGTSGDASGALRIFTQQSSGAGLVERMRITSGGNVGIGITNPGTKLTVYAGSGGISGTNDAIRLQVASYENAARNTIVWHQDASDISLGRFGIEWNLGAAQMNFVWRDVYNSAVGTTELMRLTGDGNLRMASGTGGIQFNGDTAAANALDDYEEGTWTPTISGLNLSVARANYVKIGSLVYIMATMGYGSGTGSGNIIGGLPFAASTGNRSGLSFGNVNGINWGSGATSPFGFVYESTIACYGFSNNAGFTTADFSSFGSLDFIEFSAVYSTL